MHRNILCPGPRFVNDFFVLEKQRVILAPWIQSKKSPPINFLALLTFLNNGYLMVLHTKITLWICFRSWHKNWVFLSYILFFDCTKKPLNPEFTYTHPSFPPGNFVASGLNYTLILVGFFNSKIWFSACVRTNLLKFLFNENC